MIDENEQLNRERQQHQKAFDTFKSRCEEQELKNDGSNTSYARHWKRHVFADLIVGLQMEIDNPDIYVRSSTATDAVRKCLGIKLVKNKRQKKDVVSDNQVAMFDLELCAFVALQMTLDNALAVEDDTKIIDRKTGKLKKCRGQKNRDELIVAISNRIEQQLYFKYVDSIFPEFFRQASKRCAGGKDDMPRSSSYYWRYNMNDAIRKKKEKLLLEGNYAEAELLDWKPFEKYQRKHVGQWLLSGCIKFTGLFRETRLSEKSSKQIFVKLSDLFEQRKEQYFADHKPFIWEDLPMICSPVEATKDNYGSWLTTTEQSKPDSHKGYLEISELTLSYINRLQTVPYKINPFVATVMDLLYDKKHKLGKFVPHEYTKPRSPSERLNLGYIQDYKEQADAMHSLPKEEVAKAMKEASIEEGKQIKLLERSVQSRTIYLAMCSLRDYPELFYPYSWDFRQRAYSRCTSSPSPQGPDYSKALLKFSDEQPVDGRTKHYLSIELANNAGMDKLNFDKRLKWTKENESNIKLVATMMDDDGDFSGAISFLEGIAKENPWQFMAAAEEYYHCCMIGDRKTTSIRVGMDMSCSGAGLMAGIRRCKTGATLVNVFPTNEPQDLYRACWDALVSLNKEEQIPPIRTELLDKLTELKHGRSIAKKMIMVAQYAASDWKQSQELYEYHDALPEELKLNKDEIKSFKALWKEAMKKVCSFSFVVDWFQARAQEIYDSGAKEIRIPTPTGSVQRMFYPEYEVKQVKSFYSGSLKYKENKDTKITEYIPTDKPNLDKWLSSITANAIHSLDGSCLTIGLHDFPVSFSTVHDAVYCYASSSMDDILERLKAAFIETVSFDIWTEFLKANNLPTDNPKSYPPIVGNLDLSQVMQSDYIFA